MHNPHSAIALFAREGHAARLLVLIIETKKLPSEDALTLKPVYGEDRDPRVRICITAEAQRIRLSGELETRKTDREPKGTHRGRARALCGKAASALDERHLILLRPVVVAKLPSRGCGCALARRALVDAIDLGRVAPAHGAVRVRALRKHHGHERADAEEGHKERDPHGWAEIESDTSRGGGPEPCSAMGAAQPSSGRFTLVYARLVALCSYHVA